MAAPSFISKGTLGSGTGSSVSFTFPSGIASNDLLFLVVFDYGLGTFTVNSSWTAISSMVYPTGVPNLQIKLYWKSASGTESGSQSVTRSGYSAGIFMAQVYQYRGNAYLTRESYSQNQSNSSTINYNSTTVSGTERTLCAILLNYNSSSASTPSGYTASATDNYSSTYLHLFTKANVSAGTATTSTGGSSSGYFTFHVSIYNSVPVVTTYPPRSYIVN